MPPVPDSPLRSVPLTIYMTTSLGCLIGLLNKHTMNKTDLLISPSIFFQNSAPFYGVSIFVNGMPFLLSGRNPRGHFCSSLPRHHIQSLGKYRLWLKFILNLIPSYLINPFHMKTSTGPLQQALLIPGSHVCLLTNKSDHTSATSKSPVASHYFYDKIQI